jgi:oxygen-independent coproporphyrinogen-3 oxidase
VRLALAEADRFAVYVHWPFCAAKCPYCDFNSHVRHGGWDEAAYRKAYLDELAWTRGRTGPQTVHSVFFGGGTPSLMQPQTTAAILDAIAGHWSIEPGAEITLEANPGSVEAEKFAGFKAAGVNRVSLGVQSLDDAQLARLGRIHSVAEAKRAIEIARRTFERFSFDLIYARPGQTTEMWRAELTEALALAGAHLSLYQLTIEPATPFAALHKAGKLVLPDDDIARDLYALTEELTAAKGLPAYEVSNYAAPGEESRHNLVYWRYGAYAGIGPGAHGRLPVDGKRHATVAEKSPEGWRARVREHGHGLVEDATLARDVMADEALLMGLRLVEGVDLSKFMSRFGVVPASSTIAGLIDLGLLGRHGARVAATLPGRLVLNAVVAELAAAM